MEPLGLCLVRIILEVLQSSSPSQSSYVVVAVVLVVVVVAVLGFRADTFRVSATISVWVS